MRGLQVIKVLTSRRRDAIAEWLRSCSSVVIEEGDSSNLSCHSSHSLFASSKDAASEARVWDSSGNGEALWRRLLTKFVR